jgi:hypothetical protein
MGPVSAAYHVRDERHRAQQRCRLTAESGIEVLRECGDGAGRMSVSVTSR